VGSAFSAFLAGFLFGMPHNRPINRVDGRTAEGEDSSSASRKAISSIRASANLESIADWLTKIVLGIGLAQFQEVKATVRRLFDYVAMNEPAVSASGAFVIWLFFAPPGFLVGYFYARTFFTRLFALADQ